MEKIAKISSFLTRFIGVVIIIFSVFSFFVPSAFAWTTNYTSVFLGVAMFGMGLTIKMGDFRVVFSHPKEIVLGCICQYTIMPLCAWGLAVLLHLDSDLALGVILVGCCPGGVSSNIMSYLCGGDVAFSVGMTTVSTILSPVMTPLMVSFLASGTKIAIHGFPMLISIVETVIVPVAIGFLINFLYGQKKWFQEVQKIMPGIAVLGLACVVGGVISSQGAKFFQSGIVIFAAVLLHNSLGYLLGYGAGKLTGMNTAKKRTISIEVGMQNAGLATNLATTTAQFASTPESAIICAVSCVWHSISGTLLAGFFSWTDKHEFTPEHKRAVN